MPIFLLSGGLALGGGFLGVRLLSLASKGGKEDQKEKEKEKEKPQKVLITQHTPGGAVLSARWLRGGLVRGCPDEQAFASPGGGEGAAKKKQQRKQKQKEKKSPTLFSPQDAEFELWVETELDSAWCLENDCADDDTACSSGSSSDSSNSSSVSSRSRWRDACSTSTLRRRWSDFEELNTQRLGEERDVSCQPIAFRPAEAEVLGLPEGAAAVDAAQVKAAYRKRCLACHPDKGGDSASFATLAAAYAKLRKGA